MKKNRVLMLAAIYAIIFAVYNMIVFMVFDNLNNVFWISYGFMVTVLILHILVVYSLSLKGTLNAFFLGIPLISFSLFFLIAELFTSFVFMYFREHVGIKITILIQMLILAAFLVISIITLMTKGIISDADKEKKQNIVFIKGATVEVDLMINRCSDTYIKKELIKLSEVIRYSDPMTTPIAENVESKIRTHMALLSEKVDENDNNGIMDECVKIIALFKERNAKIMVTK